MIESDASQKTGFARCEATFLVSYDMLHFLRHQDMSYEMLIDCKLALEMEIESFCKVRSISLCARLRIETA